jgi:hypothetical protein
MGGAGVLGILLAVIPAANDSLPGWAIPIVLAVVIAIAAIDFFLQQLGPSEIVLAPRHTKVHHHGGPNHLVGLRISSNDNAAVCPVFRGRLIVAKPARKMPRFKGEHGGDLRCLRRPDGDILPPYALGDLWRRGIVL